MINTNFSNIPENHPVSSHSTSLTSTRNLTPKAKIGAPNAASQEAYKQLELHTQTMLTHLSAFRNRHTPSDNIVMNWIMSIISTVQKSITGEPSEPEAKRLAILAEKKIAADPAFNCPKEVFDKYCPAIEKHLNSCLGNHLAADQKFDAAAFLRGKQGNSSESNQTNEKFINQSVDFVGKIAAEISKERKLPLTDAYKMLIGLLDSYEDVSNFVHAKVDPNFASPSTFILRSAILLSSQAQGASLPSWMAYTKSGKPDHKDIWPFLDDWNNWVPETQGAMMKFAETTFIKAKELADKYPDNHLILLKGGFGAGKTRLAGELVQESVKGVVAPDYGKRVVRQSMEILSHGSAHIQGSQIAYRLFEDMIKEITGSIVYDSSLRWAKDVKGYLEKSEKVGKKMIVYDVARHDMARVLSVLKRNVRGDDPRILPEDIIKFAIEDTIDRANCMNLILHAEINAGKEHLAPEYHFISGDAEGWNNEKVLIISPGKLQKTHEEALHRLELEGINISVTTDKNGDYKITMAQALKKEQLEKYFEKEFELPVKEVMENISSTERETLTQVFRNRVFALDILSKGAITDAATFYEAMPEEIKSVLSKQAVVEAFDSLKKGTRENFFKKLSPQLSYLDLPLRAALIIHANLQRDPWIAANPSENLLQG